MRQTHALTFGITVEIEPLGDLVEEVVYKERLEGWEHVRIVSLDILLVVFVRLSLVLHVKSGGLLALLDSY